MRLDRLSHPLTEIFDKFSEILYAFLEKFYSRLILTRFFDYFCRELNLIGSIVFDPHCAHGAPEVRPRNGVCGRWQIISQVLFVMCRC